jgi:hypothetical protein
MAETQGQTTNPKFLPLFDHVVMTLEKNTQ